MLRQDEINHEDEILVGHTKPVRYQSQGLKDLTCLFSGLVWVVNAFIQSSFQIPTFLPSPVL